MEPKQFHFIPDIESINEYFTAYDKDGKMLGKSNRWAAIEILIQMSILDERFQGAYIIYKNKKYVIADFNIEESAFLKQEFYYRHIYNSIKQFLDA